MDITKKEKIFLTIALTVVGVGILVLGALIFLDYSKEEEPSTAQVIEDTTVTNDEGIEEYVPVDACGDGICTEGETISCSIDCTAGIVQESSNSSVALSDEIQKIAQTFTTEDDNWVARKLGLYFKYPSSSAFTYSIFEMTSDVIGDGVPIYEGEFGPFESYFENYVSIENEPIKFKADTTYSLVLEPTTLEENEILIAINTDAEAYEDGNLSVYGKLFDEDGNVLDDEMQWREIDGAAQFSFLFWIDEVSE